jgi:Arm DNA-binding domain
MPPGKTEHIEFDDEMHGFGLRIRKGAGGEHRTLIAQYKIGTKHRRITLGNVDKVNFEHARREAKKIFGRVANEEDPAIDRAEARKIASHTFDAAIKQYLTAKKDDLRPSTYNQAKHHLEALWKPLHSLALGSITRPCRSCGFHDRQRTRAGCRQSRSRQSLGLLPLGDRGGALRE